LHGSVIAIAIGRIEVRIPDHHKPVRERPDLAIHHMAPEPQFIPRPKAVAILGPVEDRRRRRPRQEIDTHTIDQDRHDPVRG
jgi:hypothetical protein